MTKEQKFYKALQDVFIGAKIEGQGGFVNLMKIKSNYYQKIEKFLKDDIEKALEKYPSFREELFDKLYNFFNRYFTESGSIYFNSTPFHNNVYEKVYTDEKDVILFWKTQMLYYVKTDRIFKSMPVEFDNYRFYFDASTIENKKANEKRSLIYELNQIKEDQIIVFNVYYSEKGRVTKTKDILEELKKKNIKIDEERLERAFRIFEKQSEVDFFINKNAKAFLQEQFKLWSYQYFWEGAKEWTADRVNELQILKDIAFKIIDFISQFEDELVKIWNKPKFVKNSNYVITLDRIYKNSPSMKGWQAKPDGVVEWYDLPFNPELKERAKELRKAGNLSEVLLWQQLKNKQLLGLDFDRQKIIGNYIVDLYCKNLGVVIEIDGASHNDKIEYDKVRDEYLKSLGLRVIHISDLDVKKNLEGVMAYLKSELTNTPSANADTPLQEGNLLEKILNHTNINEQIKEWQELGIVDEKFKTSDVFENDLNGKYLSKKYEHLPIDTKYFKDLEPEILSLFDDLDNQLDGWLIKSENYQALNTILPKFKEKVQTIYIDPPFNLDSSDQFMYRTNYKDANWATLLENRLRIAKEWLNEKGSIFVRCDYNGNWIVRCLMDEIFGKENFRNEIILNRKRQSIGTPDKLENESENLFLYSKSEFFYKNDIYKSRSLTNIKWTGFLKQEKRNPPERYFFGKKLIPPDNQHFSLIQEKVDKLLNENYLRLKCKECDAIYYFDDEERKEKFIDYILKAKDKFKYYDITNKSKVYGIKTLDKCLNCNSDNWKVEYLTSDESKITDNWKDIPSYSDKQNFSTENSENLLKRVVELTTKENNIVIDFFLGSGTTIAVAHKLGRKWIGVEMGEHFYTVVLPRMKKVLAYDKSGISKELKTPRQTSSDTPLQEGIYQGGGFFKYYELEQYEETLANTVYENHDMYIAGNKSVYEQYAFLKDEKMLKALEIDYENNKVKVDLSKLYANIDIAETLSNLTGKWIKKIKPDEVEFEDGTVVNTKDLDYKLIKPLIWWE
ncbi:MAG TPA: DNA methyltransferase [Candidatus Hydrogenedens sp.]|nr:DNA methyltransferase [Candidatus Hydrogenedens sp.]